MAEVKTESQSQNICSISTNESTTTEDNGLFTREVELESQRTSLKFYQREIGDVSCVIWDASLVLAHYIEKRASKNASSFQDLTVVELGAGVGCVGIVAGCFGANVIMTDLPSVLPLLERNIEENRVVWSKAGGHVKVQQLRWGDMNSIHAPNLLLLADCVYYLESITPLIETMKQLSSKDTEILICQERRDSDKQRLCWKQFTTELDKYFKFEAVPLSEQHSVFSSPDIILLKGFVSENVGKSCDTDEHIVSTS